MTVYEFHRQEGQVINVHVSTFVLIILRDLEVLRRVAKRSIIAQPVRRRIYHNVPKNRQEIETAEFRKNADRRANTQSAPLQRMITCFVKGQNKHSGEVKRRLTRVV